jgi:hypothetical protein
MLKVLGTVRPFSLFIEAAIINAALELDILAHGPMVITVGANGKHMVGSKHGTHEALDFRTNHLPTALKHLLVATVARRLGPDYDVLLEGLATSNEHGHAEHDPKPKRTAKKKKGAR